MQCYTEILPPTAVTHAINLPFLSPKASTLIVAKTSLLQIFDVADGKLVLVAEYQLAGTVISLARIKALDTKSGGEALLVALKDAKLSLVEWDPETFSIATVSLHYYEAEELQTCPWDLDLDQCHNYLVADPTSRCAALKFGARHLAILPFRRPDDDVVDGDYDPELDDPLDAPPAKPVLTNGTNGDTPAHQTPYKASFVLPLTAIDPTLSHPVHLDFLHEYRQPTFGILAAPRAPSSTMLAERKDSLDYTVYTLDLEQKASTALLSVSGLPYDLHRVVPLPLPVGGALLVGCNELIHVDQAGKVTAVAVNEFAHKASSLSMTDQSSLAIKLEGCVIEQLGDSGDMLILLNTGDIAVLGFERDGRSVSGIKVQKVSQDRGGSSQNTAASCTAPAGRGKIFVGSEDGSSLILGFSSKAVQLSRKRSHAEMLAQDEELSFDEDDLDDDLDDDLYASNAGQETSAASSESDLSAYSFTIHDTLTNLGPIRDVAWGSHSVTMAADMISSATATVADEVSSDMVLAVGRGRSGGLAVLQRDVRPVLLNSVPLPSAYRVWSVTVHAPIGEEKSAAALDVTQYVAVSCSGSNGESSTLYRVNGMNLEETTEGDFERGEGATVAVGTLAGGTRMVQVLKADIRSLEPDLGLAQAIPLEDEETETQYTATAASFGDPYLLVVRDDSSVVMFSTDKDGELEELDRGDTFTNTKFASGCLYRGVDTGEETLAFLLTTEGGLHIYALPNLEKAVFVADGFSFLPPFLTQEYAPKRSSGKARLAEILVADLGDAKKKSPHLIARTEDDRICIYRPYNYPHKDERHPIYANLRWLKLEQTRQPVDLDDEVETSLPTSSTKLTPFRTETGFTSVFVTGKSPSFIFKESTSTPKVLGFSSQEVKGFCPLGSDDGTPRFAYLDDQSILRICCLPSNASYGGVGWSLTKVHLGRDVQSLCWQAPYNVYAVGSNRTEGFQLPEDDHHREWASEHISLRPEVPHGSIELLHPDGWVIIDSHDFEPFEAVLTVKSLNLEVSEITHERKDVVCVGTAFIKGEDLASRGCIYVFEVITVVPEPGRPETNRKLKLLVREEVRGAVTAIDQIGRDGFLIMAQGQKCLVRGLKEDLTLLPVGFMDMQTYVTSLKVLPGTNMMIQADAMKGLWFSNFTEDPFSFVHRGKSRSEMEVVAAEFLPDEKSLYFLVADESNLHVLQYDPEHPKSLSGQRLLHKSSYHTGHFTTSMVLLPSSRNPASTQGVVEDGEPQASTTQFQVLAFTQAGSINLITPLDEQQYRRLGALQTHLTNLLDHPCGLNPRAYRAVESEGIGTRGIVDGNIVRRWCELGSQKRAEACAKVGMEEWVLASDLTWIGGGGLSYL